MKQQSKPIRFWGTSMADSRSLLHQGQTTERDVKSASARTGFDDLARSVSGFMQVLFPAIGGWNTFYTPKEGDQVVVCRLPNGAEEGYIIGKVYTANKMPQGGAENIILLVSDDAKNVVRLDADNGTLDVIVDQTGTFKFKNLKFSVTENFDIETDKAFKTKSKEDVEIVSDKAMAFKSTSGADLLEIGNAVATMGKMISDLLQACISFKSVGSPATHTAPDFTAAATEIKAKWDQVFK